MFSLVKRLSFLMVTVGFVSSAHADLLIEPYLGYHLGSYKSGSTTTDQSGVSFGARLGYQQLGFMAGLDYMTGKWTDKDTPKNDVTPSNLGLFVGYNFPVMLRAYGVYGIANSTKVESSGSSTKLEGSPQIKIGVGFTALPIVSINLEYMSATFDKANGNTFTPNITSSMYGVTVSAPFDL